MMDWKLPNIKLYIRRNMMINVIIQTIFLTEPRADREQTEQCECTRIRPYRERTVTGTWPELCCESALKNSFLHYTSMTSGYTNKVWEKYVFCGRRELRRLLSLLSMGGVCGRSLSAGKILFAGRQTCSLYLVLWLCVLFCRFQIFGLACDNARALCGGKIARAEPVGCFVYKVSCLLWL